MDLGETTCIADLLKHAMTCQQDLRELPWFRGHCESTWSLKPSAHRRHPGLEAQFSQHFRLRAPSVHPRCPPHRAIEEWLPLMRHFGLPTRLLDWSESILVAAYFATTTNKDSDGKIWVLSPSRLNELTIGGFIPFLHDDRVLPIVEAAFGKNPANSVPNALSVIAPRTDARMTAQLGNYSIHHERWPLESLPNASMFLRYTTIPAAAKKHIQHELSICGIRPSLLFPDLETLAREISDLIALDAEGNEIEVVDA